MSKIILSIGHDQIRQGASCGGITEYVLSKRIAEHIDHPDVIVVDQTLRETVDTINSWPEPVSLAAELHWNSSYGGKASGCETLYYPGSKAGQEAAQEFQSAYLCNATAKDRGVKEGWYRMQTNGAVDYFLRATKCKSIILEPEFIQIACEWEELDYINAAIYLQVALLHARG